MNDKWEIERSERERIQKSILPTGCAWLDDGWSGGLNGDQLFLVAAQTGVGKTHFGVQVATAASRHKRRVFYFALEASRGEIERRRLYTELHRVLREHMPELKMPRFREWLHQESTPEWQGIERHAIEKIEALDASLTVKYRTGGTYSPEDFQLDVHDLVHEQPDLIVLDHLHHFLLQGQENDALKAAIRTIDKLKGDVQVPIIVLAQVRKTDTKNHRSLCRLDDIRGTASLTDMATDVMLISRPPGEMSLPATTFNPTLMHVAKSRTAPEMQQLVAAIGFDYKTGEYQGWYGVFKNKEHEVPEVIFKSQIPAWAKNGRATAEIGPTRERFFGTDSE